MGNVKCCLKSYSKLVNKKNVQIKLQTYQNIVLTHIFKIANARINFLYYFQLIYII